MESKLGSGDDYEQSLLSDKSIDRLVAIIYSLLCPFIVSSSTRLVYLLEMFTDPKMTTMMELQLSICTNVAIHAQSFIGYSLSHTKPCLIGISSSEHSFQIQIESDASNFVIVSAMKNSSMMYGEARLRFVHPG